MSYCSYRAIHLMLITDVQQDIVIVQFINCCVLCLALTSLINPCKVVFVYSLQPPRRRMYCLMNVICDRCSVCAEVAITLLTSRVLMMSCFTRGGAKMNACAACCNIDD